MIDKISDKALLIHIYQKVAYVFEVEREGHGIGMTGEFLESILFVRM
jgi:hypothetical protein